MMNEEVNVIGHLLDVEKNAEQLVSDAQIEASKRISAAKAASDSEYKKLYADLAVRLEQEYQEKIAEISASHEKNLKVYKEKIQGSEKDEKSFYALLDSILFSA
ncbi:MAG: hypothetical protein ACI4LR_02350 [Treponema sp.]|nr:hypothetical protein [Treponema sp.]